MIDTVAVLESTVPSLALNVNESGPVYPALGVYVNAGADPLNVPCPGPATTEYVNASPSLSLADNVTAFAVFCGVLTD